MRSKNAAKDDLSTAARVREAAVDVFGREGFGASVRRVAAAAGVSPALVIHHYGTKDKLRAACDTRVLKTIRDTKTASAAGGPQLALAQLAAVGQHAADLRYALRSVQSGGPLARAFFEDMVTDAVAYLRAGVAAGTVKPSRDEAARARHLARASLGSLMLELALRSDQPLGDGLPDLLHEITHTLALPAIELYTQGLFTTSAMLDAYLAATSPPPQENP